MQKRLIAVFGIFLVVLIVVFFIRTSDKDSLNQNVKALTSSGNVISNVPSEISDNILGNPPSKITLNQISKHNSVSDCWVIYNGKVYDITSFLPKHAGSAGAISPYCGTNGFETAFTKKHGTSKANMLMRVGTFIGDFNIVGSV